MIIPFGIYFASKSFFFKSLLCITIQVTCRRSSNSAASGGSSKDRTTSYTINPLLIMSTSTIAAEEDLRHPWYSPYYTSVVELPN
jgi:hypothetical protein